MESLLEFLRDLVKQRAARAGREDILANLKGADPAQLQSWLTELEPHEE